MKMFQDGCVCSAVILLLASFSNFRSIKCYSQVAVASNDGANEGPKIYKAMNMDLIFPKSFNSTVNVISTTTRPLNNESSQQQQSMPVPAAIFVTPASVIDDGPRTMLLSDIEAQQSHAHQLPAEMRDNEQHQPNKQEQQQTHEQEQFTATGRAVDYRGGGASSAYHINQLITPLMKNAQLQQPSSYGYGQRVRRPPAYAVQSRPPSRQQTISNIGQIVYPQGQRLGPRPGQGQGQRRQPPSRAEIDKFRGQAQLSDRFTPSEGVASALFSQKHKHHHDHSHDHAVSNKGNGAKRPAASSLVQSYVPPKNVYSFPPNIDSKYPSPSQDPRAALPSGTVSSYVAPASGTLTNTAGYPLASASSSSGYQYPGPLTGDAGPPTADGANGNGAGGGDDQKDDGGGGGGDDDTIGVLPASAMDMDMGANPGKDAPMDDGGLDSDSANGGMNMAADDHNHDHDHGHDHPMNGYDDDKEYPTPPPGWLEEHPDAAHDHPPSDHAPPPDHHHHDHDPVPFDFHDHHPHHYPIYTHHYPELIYDDHDHDHYHHHHHIETTLPPPTTDPPPPPEPAPEPRVKKYSYFYIGRKLWYIPLYFTVWFSFYVLWLILKSIARHKVNLPNHYVNRRSLPALEELHPDRYINELTVRVLAAVDAFQEKYS